MPLQASKHWRLGQCPLTTINWDVEYWMPFVNSCRFGWIAIRHWQHTPSLRGALLCYVWPAPRPVAPTQIKIFQLSCDTETNRYFIHGISSWGVCCWKPEGWEAIPNVSFITAQASGYEPYTPPTSPGLRDCLVLSARPHKILGIENCISMYDCQYLTCSASPLENDSGHLAAAIRSLLISTAWRPSFIART